MSFSEPPRTGQYSAPLQRQTTRRDLSSPSSDTVDTYLLEQIVEHVLELPAERQSNINTISRAVEAPTPGKNSKNPYLGWARCPTFSIPPAVAQKMATGWTGTETYEGFFSRLESSKRATTLSSSAAAAAAGGSYYRRDYDSPPRKFPRSSPRRATAAPIAPTPCDTPQICSTDTLTGPRSENGTVDPRLVCPPPSSTSYIDISYSSPTTTKAIQRPLPGFEVSSAEKELIKMFPSYSQSIKVVPAVIFCNRCKQEIPTDPQAIIQHAAIHLINPKEDRNKFGCLVGNCWRRLPLHQLGTHVAGHFQGACASCGMCGMVFPSPQLAREHLVAPCSQLQDSPQAPNHLTTHTSGQKAWRKQYI